MSNIYYLSAGKGTSYAGRLYRMRPGAIQKEVVGVSVTGYIVLSDDVVYYCDGERVMKAKSWNSIKLKLPDDEELNEEGEIVRKISISSTLPVVNDQGEKLAVDISELPKPDEEILIETNKSREENKETESSKRETTKERTTEDTKESSSKESSVRVEVGLSPSDINKSSTRPKKVENVEIGVGPKVVEVEAPQ